ARLGDLSRPVRKRKRRAAARLLNDCPASRLFLRRVLLAGLDEAAVLVGGQLAIAVGIGGGEHPAERGMRLGFGAADVAVAVAVQVGPALALAAGGGVLALLLG